MRCARSRASSLGVVRELRRLPVQPASKRPMPAGGLGAARSTDRSCRGRRACRGTGSPCPCCLQRGAAARAASRACARRRSCRRGSCGGTSVGSGLRRARPRLARRGRTWRAPCAPRSCGRWSWRRCGACAPACALLARRAARGGGGRGLGGACLRLARCPDARRLPPAAAPAAVAARGRRPAAGVAAAARRGVLASGRSGRARGRPRAARGTPPASATSGSRSLGTLAFFFLSVM